MISPDHLAMLAGSGITPEHAALRGDETITDRARLDQINIVWPGWRTPDLLIPLPRVDGSIWGHQYRPDYPRLGDGKLVNNETPWEQHNGLDIPPGVGELLDDPNQRLWIVEGRHSWHDPARGVAQPPPECCLSWKCTGRRDRLRLNGIQRDISGLCVMSANSTTARRTPDRAVVNESSSTTGKQLRRSRDDQPS